MKRWIYVINCGIILILSSCSGSLKSRFPKDVGIKYDTIYSLPAIGTTKNYTFTTNTNDIIINVKENKTDKDGCISLSGFDGTNYFHEGTAIEIEKFLELMFIIISNNNYVFKGNHQSENLDIYVETQYESGMTPESKIIHEEILAQLSILFDFTITEVVLPNTIYTFTVKDREKTESFYIDLPSKYKAYAGWSDLNVNRKKKEYYFTFPQYLYNKKVQGNFQYIDNTGLDGVFTLPYVEDEIITMEKFMSQCNKWGIEISESVEERATIVLTFNE